MLTSEPQWVAIYTNPRAEKRAEHNLNEAGYEVYLPLRHEMHIWSDRKKWVDTPLIKSYIFAKITKQQEMLLRNIQGVSHIIKFKDNVVTIPEREIQMMKDFLAAEIDVQVRTVEQLVYGKHVRIRNGSLAGRTGVLVSNCEEGNFAVEITGISMAMVIYIDKDLLEVIPDEELPKPKKRKKYTIR